MESAASNSEDESGEKPHPVPPSAQEGSSHLLCEEGGMKSAARKSNKQQPLCTDHLTDTMLASQGDCDTSSFLECGKSDPSTECDSSSWEILPTDSEEEKLQAHKRSAELLGYHHTRQKSPPKSSDDTSGRTNKEMVPCHQRREEPVEQRDSNRRDDCERKEDLGPDSRFVHVEICAMWDFSSDPKDLEIWELAGRRAVFGRRCRFSTVRLLQP
ncbi:PREDICTED: uncharacterized protein LOC106902357 [Calidris pugnax]|uniref:uncharacterized protein LOC106902357 n=1 Tax=Calidris pugnax TaxID=198806 RepID=UPI00071CF9D9|nr:PREDICTED: uncharacterized protein LOC106902357 [Calidris pugnax]